MAQCASLRSDDEETKAGAIIVNKNNRIVATGYNGTPKGTNLPKTRPDKYPYMVHAEENAMLFAPENLTGHRIYLYGLPCPCNVCARMMIQKGIEEVIVVNPETKKGSNNWNYDSTYEMFKQVNMGFREIKVPIVSIDFI